MVAALACRPETVGDDPLDDINARVLAIFERGQVPWVLPWRLAVTQGEVRLSEVRGNDVHDADFDLPARLVVATNPTAPRDVDAEFHELFAATGINFRMGAVRTFYSHSEDMIALSDWRISDPTEFLRDWIHELLHAVGHSSRLDRDLPRGFGSNAQGKEDLIAEIGTAFMCASLGIEPSLRHPDCLDTWVGLLRSDDATFVQAVRSADAAAGYLFARRDAQAAAFDRLEAEEAAAERDAAAREAAVRRRKWRRERERWAFGSATGSRPGESLLAARRGDLA